jgi:zeaxanthin glucosyltransferase
MSGATIVVLVDTEEGHIMPTFWLSRYLKARGHRVCYLGLSSVESIVRSQGFEFFSITGDVSLKDGRYDSQREAYDDDYASIYFGPLVRGELLDGIIAKLRPSVALILSKHYLEGLAIHYRHQLPIVFVTPMFRRHARIRTCENVIAKLLDLKSGVAEFLELLVKAGARFRGFRGIAQLVLHFPELALLPEAFDLPGSCEDSGVYYVGAGVDRARNDQPFPWADIDSGSPIVYCARGSQVQLQKEASRRLFQVTVDAAAARPEWRFIIATSKVFKAEDFTDVPPNLVLFDWIHQLEVLSRANVMINHGGFGTIKECIQMGVPMVILPLKGFRDHTLCAERVVHHGLGVQNDDLQVSPDKLILLLEQVMNDPSFNHRVNLMREKIERQDRLEFAATVIERAIASFDAQGAETDVTAAKSSN